MDVWGIAQIMVYANKINAFVMWIFTWMIVVQIKVSLLI